MVYHRTQQYSVVGLTGKQGEVLERYAYTAYGKPTILAANGLTELDNSAYANRYLYTGREWDPTIALYHYRARMYDPADGRFISRDPIGFEGSPWNLYEYVGGAPLGIIDPLGLGPSAPGSGSGIVWGVSNYFMHYYMGFGADVDIKSTGLFGPWITQVQNQIDNKLENEVINKLNNQVSCDNPHISAKDSLQVQTTATAGGPFGILLLIMGTSHVKVNYDCNVTLECDYCCDGSIVPLKRKSSCTMSLSVRDRFSNPSDWHRPDYERDEEAYQACIRDCWNRYPIGVFETAERNACLRNCDREHPRSEWYGAIPYTLKADWEDSKTSEKQFPGCPERS